ncbi:sigma-54-dependent transcriptional regulator [Planctomycetota bacterium]
MSTSHILIADDQADVLKALRLLLKPEGYTLETASSTIEIEQAAIKGQYDAVLMDMNYVRGETSGEQGLNVLARLRKIDPTLPVIVMTGWSSVELAVEAMRQGARDFVPKPWKNERLLAILRTQVDLGRALRRSQRLEQENVLLKDEVTQSLVAESPAMHPILDTIARVGPSDANVLITGENGSGKGVVAQALHRASSRRSKTLVTVNTASIPETIFESELFGHIAGAFTDAKKDRLGRFQLADGGTLFLDEIATIPPNLQTKLLRVLESGEFEPIGSDKTVKVDVRIISATNADLDKEIEDGNFRQDLLYRLNTVRLHIPPLQERPEDVTALAHHFLLRYQAKYRRPDIGFTPATLQALVDYPWPGNVRELDHTLERAVLMARDNQIQPCDLALPTSKDTGPCFPRMTLDELERWAIRNALDHNNSDISKSAEALGLSRAALYRRLEKYQIE